MVSFLSINNWKWKWKKIFFMSTEETNGAAKFQIHFFFNEKNSKKKRVTSILQDRTKKSVSRILSCIYR